MPLPPAHLLLGAASAEAVRAVKPLPRARAWVAGAVLGLLPDADMAYRIISGTAAPLERSVTHSLLAVAVITLAAWAVAGGRWAAVAGLAYASHLAADLLQDQRRTSVVLFWPLQQEGMDPLLRVFPGKLIVRGDGVWVAARSLLEPEALRAVATETAIAAAVFGVVLAVGWTVRRLRRVPA